MSRYKCDSLPFAPEFEDDAPIIEPAIILPALPQAKNPEPAIPEPNPEKVE